MAAAKPAFRQAAASTLEIAKRTWRLACRGKGDAYMSDTQAAIEHRRQLGRNWRARNRDKVKARNARENARIRAELRQLRREAGRG